MADLKGCTSLLHTLLVKPTLKKFAGNAGKAQLHAILDLVVCTVREEKLKVPEYLVDMALELKQVRLKNNKSFGSETSSLERVVVGPIKTRGGLALRCMATAVQYWGDAAMLNKILSRAGNLAGVQGCNRCALRTWQSILMVHEAHPLWMQ